VCKHEQRANLHSKTFRNITNYTELGGGGGEGVNSQLGCLYHPPYKKLFYIGEVNYVKIHRGVYLGEYLGVIHRGVYLREYLGVIHRGVYCFQYTAS